MAIATILDPEVPCLNAFGAPPKAAMVFEADFVGGVISSSTKAKPKTGFNTFTWPAITPGADAGGVEIRSCRTR